MQVFPSGRWRIEMILIDRKTILNNEGFRDILITENELQILPAGMSFSVKQASESTAILQSRGQDFYAQYRLENDVLEIELSRSKFNETILIEAILVTNAEALSEENLAVEAALSYAN